MRRVDFADLWIVLAVKMKVFLFTLRLSYSGKAIHATRLLQRRS